MKFWKILNNTTTSDPRDILQILLSNRGFKEETEIKDFFKADINAVTLESVGIDNKSFESFRLRLDESIKKDEQIVIYGDYDVDGICASAILWETIYTKTKNVMPYIPNRQDEGYGLSIKGIDNILSDNAQTKLIITVDNGIVAYDALEYANKKGIDVIVTDHHVKGKKDPDAYCIVHTTKLCGAGIAWVLAKELGFESQETIQEKLELACLATVADLVPLTNANRAIVKKGLSVLSRTNRPGIVELLKDAKIEKETVDVYTIGHIIAPRINATGRIQNAMNALRLLCTRSSQKAKELASTLSIVNRDRQDLTEESFDHAKLLAIDNSYSNKILVVAHESYNQGVIGLIASRLVESYYKPSFAISKGTEVSKGSARSIIGVNIIELLRSVGDVLDEAGGHPMAAGFSIKTARIDEFTKVLSKKAEEVVTSELLKRYITIDLVIQFNTLTFKLYDEICKMEPFGMGNQQPIFATKKVTVSEVRKIGRDQNHLKLKLIEQGKNIDAVAFKFADKIDLEEGDIVDIAYTLDENKWNGKITLQLKIRDMKISESN